MCATGLKTLAYKTFHMSTIKQMLRKEVKYRLADENTPINFVQIVSEGQLIRLSADLGQLSALGLWISVLHNIQYQAMRRCIYIYIKHHCSHWVVDQRCNTGSNKSFFFTQYYIGRYTLNHISLRCNNRRDFQWLFLWVCKDHEFCLVRIPNARLS